MPLAHARLSPSSSSRWLVCPGSVRLIAQYEKPRKSNAPARLGTFTHQVGENLLLGESVVVGQSVVCETESPKMEYCTTSMLEEATNYYNYVKDICKKDDLHELIVEMKVDLTDIAPDTFGHADAVVVENGNLHIIDLKTGANLVDCENNSQLMLYGYGAYLELEMFHDIENVVLHIVQNNVRTGGDRTNHWSIKPDELVKWGEGVKAKAELALSEDAPCVAGEIQCKWCEASAHCPTALAEANRIIEEFDAFEADEELGEDVSINDIAKVVERSKFITNLIANYNSRIYDELVSGKEVEGYKLVKSVTRKKWANTNEAFEKLKTWSTLDEIAPRNLVSPSQAEKIIGKMSARKANIFNTLWIKPEGALSAVPASDKRTAVKPEVVEFDIIDEDDDEL